MALIAAQKVTLTEVTLRSLLEIEAATGLLGAEQEAAIIADLATWATIRDSHVKLKGGGDGVDFDNERKREAIRRRILNHLGLVPTWPPTLFALASASRGL